MKGKTPWHDIPDEYGGDEDDAMSHAFSLDYLADDLPDYMNEEEELFHAQSALDPLEQLMQEEDDEWDDDGTEAR